MLNVVCRIQKRTRKEAEVWLRLETGWDVYHMNEHHNCYNAYVQSSNLSGEISVQQPSRDKEAEMDEVATSDRTMSRLQAAVITVSTATSAIDGTIFSMILHRYFH